MQLQLVCQGSLLNMCNTVVCIYKDTIGSTEQTAEIVQRSQQEIQFMLETGGTDLVWSELN